MGRPASHAYRGGPPGTATSIQTRRWSLSSVPMFIVAQLAVAAIGLILVLYPFVAQDVVVPHLDGQD